MVLAADALAVNLRSSPNKISDIFGLVEVCPETLAFRPISSGAT